MSVQTQAPFPQGEGVWFDPACWPDIPRSVFFSEACTRGRIELATAFPADVLDDLTWKHPLAIQLRWRNAQPGVLAFGEALATFAPSDKSLHRELRIPQLYVSRRAELEVALYLLRRGVIVEYQPAPPDDRRDQKRVDLRIVLANGSVPVEVKAIRQSKSHGRHVLNITLAANRYIEAMNATGQGGWHLDVETRGDDAGPWTPIDDKELLEVIATWLGNEPRPMVRHLGSGSRVQFSPQPAPCLRSTVLGPALIHNRAHETKRLRRHLKEANEQIAAAGDAGIAVLYLLPGWEGAVEPIDVQRVIAADQLTALRAVFMFDPTCASGRSGPLEQVA